MLFKGDSLDNLLGDILRSLIRSGRRIRAGKGKARELTGVLIELTQPTARFSTTESRGHLFSFLGETLWYLSGSDRLKHIEYYIPRYRQFISASRHCVRAPGAYGPRLFGGGDNSQIARLIGTLKAKQGLSDTRQAVAQIFLQTDLRAGNGDVPCTTTIQFLPRAEKLHLAVTMRSNDAYRGFPADVFAFTFIQELVARALGLQIGVYSHFVGSLHLYENDQEGARAYLNEGHQYTDAMPDMPTGDPFAALQRLLAIEEAIRLDQTEPLITDLADYWLDLARLLKIKALFDKKDRRQLVQVKNQMHSSVYENFLRGRQQALDRHPDVQPLLPGISSTAAGAPR